MEHFHGHLHRHDDDGHAADEPMDPAQQHLADALRVSFRLLTAIMVIVVVLFFLTGIESIEPQEVGIIKTFGRIAETCGEGLVWTWPYPVGEIQKVSIKSQTVRINDFWLFETPEDEALPLDSRQVPEGGLKPGKDGALLTGDRNLLHVRLTVNYEIADAARCLKYVGDMTADLPQLLRRVVCRAAVLTAARMTADGIKRTETQRFTEEVSRLAQQQLDRLMDVNPSDPHRWRGVQIDTVSAEVEWPLRARPAFVAAQNAVSQGGKVRSEALAEAQKVLHNVVGPAYRQLVGQPWGAGGASADGAAARSGLIGRYQRARRAGEAARAQELLAEIEGVLASNAARGEVAGLIAEALAHKKNVVQKVAAWADRFEKIYPQYRKAPAFLIARIWASTLEKLFQTQLLEVYYLPLGKGKTNVLINRDPEVVRELDRVRIRQAKARKAGGGR